MGLILGKITVETPPYSVLTTTPDYEIRKYAPSVVAQVTYSPSELNNNPDGGFMILANYIGALGNPQNTIPQSPTTSEKIAMTAPVVTCAGGEEDGTDHVTMQFILPSKYKKAEEAPRPVDGRVVVREEGERKYGVVRFSGIAKEAVVKEKVERLKGWLERDGWKVTGKFLLARYNPPWTLPFLMTNEVLIPVE